MSVSKPKPFRKDKPKTRREDRVEKEEEIPIKWYKKEPFSTIAFSTFNGAGITILFIAFGSYEYLIAKFFGAAYFSYVLFYNQLSDLCLGCV